MIYITIHEGEFEDIELSRYIDKVKYFDSIKKRLVLGEEVHYRDYLIKYKKLRNSGNKYLYAMYDYNDDFIGYWLPKELSEYIGVPEQSLRSALNKGWGYGYRFEKVDTEGREYSKYDMEEAMEYLEQKRKSEEAKEVKEWYNISRGVKV